MDNPNFGAIFNRAVTLFPDKVAILQGDMSLTYAQLASRTCRVARLLGSIGVTSRDKVLMLLPNDYRFAECLCGVLHTGAIAVPVNIKVGMDTLRYIAEHSDAQVLIGHADLREQITDLQTTVPALKHIFIVGGAQTGAESYDQRLLEMPPDFATVSVNLKDPALLMYTSGSTGRPKGCIRSHEGEWWETRKSARTMMLDDHDRSLIVGPLYHANALWGCMLPMLYLGGSMAILPSFDPVAVLAAIDRYRPTYMTGTPSMFSLLLAQREALARYDVSSIELLGCGSAPVPAELLAAMIRQFDCEVIEGYGLTEGGATVFTPRWGIKKLGSCGLPVPGAEVRLVDAEGVNRECAPGEVGELWTRSPANAIGYYKQPEVTAEKFTPDGWLRTGDLLKRDEQGYLYFCGRKDDMINCGGENVYPKEVENILLTHPDIDDVCVVPVSHSVKGQAPAAWVVLRANRRLTEDEVKQYFLARGPAYAHPRRVFFSDRLPVSGTNKVDRKGLTEEARRRSLEEPPGGGD
jgi:acyl-CoA synthetase (AMP-forming)/AMP-acid ligase II